MGSSLRECRHGEKAILKKDKDSWKLVHFIRHLPKITPQEIAEMKKYNPMTRQEREEQETLERFLAGEDVELPAEHQH